MVRKFVEGLVFGSGFALAFVAVWYFAAFVIQPMLFASQIQEATGRTVYEDRDKGEDLLPSEVLREMKQPFHELGLDEQIERASVIALAKYERAADGKMKAIIKEFLKKAPDTTIYYDIGDEYPSASYYPKEGRGYGDGLVIFFTGSPAMMKMSMTYAGDRIHSLGDLPVELLREKCKSTDRV